MMNYNLEDLFDKRSVVGARLEDLLVEKSVTKAGFCKECGISRPTLDKLLAGSISSKANFEKHMKKILSVLSITPDYLLGNVKNAYSRVREIRNVLNIKQERIAQSTSISSDRLHAIEAGDDASVAELREIALCLRTGTRCIDNSYFFYPQMSIMDNYICFDSDNTASHLSGFWGHIGVLPKNSKEYLWYPITRYHAELIRENINNNRTVVPCMNNKVLYLNMNQIDSIILLSDDCEPPVFANWDPSVGEGKIPLVIYEVLDDMDYENDVPEDLMSPAFKNDIKNYIEENSLTEEKIFDLTAKMTVRFSDGKDIKYYPDYISNDSLFEEIRSIYLYGDEENEKYVGFTDDEVEIMINTDNISMIELPLLKVEEAIIKGYEDE